MPKQFPLKSKGFHPFGELIGLNFSEYKNGYSTCILEINEKLLNPHRVLHGGVIYTMADTGMGAALYSYLDRDEICGTIEINIIYFTSVTSGVVTCETKVIHKSKSIAALESEIRNDECLIAKAMGTFSIFKARGD